jgi:hypothetical protein
MDFDPGSVVRLITELIRLAVALIELIKNWPKGPRCG